MTTHRLPIRPAKQSSPVKQAKKTSFKEQYKVKVLSFIVDFSQIANGFKIN